ncbi:MAG TPA: hypothetical protein VGH07_02605 [Chthoniobacterales bacterium]
MRSELHRFIWLSRGDRGINFVKKRSEHPVVDLAPEAAGDAPAPIY